MCHGCGHPCRIPAHGSGGGRSPTRQAARITNRSDSWSTSGPAGTGLVVPKPSPGAIVVRRIAADLLGLSVNVRWRVWAAVWDRHSVGHSPSPRRVHEPGTPPGLPDAAQEGESTAATSRAGTRL